MGITIDGNAKPGKEAEASIRMTDKLLQHAKRYRHPDIQAVVDATSPSPLGQARSEQLGVCAFCQATLGKFRNELSQREYKISGLCQKCQDSTFGQD